jgi:hypothetical protein
VSGPFSLVGASMSWCSAAPSVLPSGTVGLLEPRPQPGELNWHGNATEPDWGKPQSKIDDTVRQTGLYMTTRLNLADDLKLLLGGRGRSQVTGNNPPTRKPDGSCRMPVWSTT